MLREDDNDDQCIDEQLKKARRRWHGIERNLKREGANARVMCNFYLVIVQALLLYGSESWAITGRQMKKLESFHKRAVRHMTGSHIRKEGENWEYPDHRILLIACGLFPMKTYIERRRSTLKQFLIKYRKNLMEDTEKVKRQCKNVNKVLWWDQPVLNKEDMENRATSWFKT